MKKILLSVLMSATLGYFAAILAFPLRLPDSGDSEDNDDGGKRANRTTLSALVTSRDLAGSGITEKSIEALSVEALAGRILKANTYFDRDQALIKAVDLLLPESPEKAVQLIVLCRGKSPKGDILARVFEAGGIQGFSEALKVGIPSLATQSSQPFSKPR